VTFEEAVQEVSDRGYSYIKTSRIQRFVNRAHKSLCSRYRWPFLETTKEGAGPLTIADVRHVLDVNDLTNRANLDPIDIRRVRRMDPDLSSTGAPEYWYIDGEQLHTWPESSVTLQVRYLRKALDLSGSAALLVPDEFHELIIDWAVTYCLKDDDEYDVARELKAQVEEGVTEMFHALAQRNYQRPESADRTGPAGSYL
jgi:hypothetical protein